MLIEPGDYLINSVSEKGQALSYTPPTDSIGVAVAGEQGSKFHISKVGDVYTIQVVKEGTFALINVEPPGYPLVNADGLDPVLWKIVPTDIDPEKYMIVVYDGGYKGNVWLVNRLGSDTPLVMVAPNESPDPHQQFTFTKV